MNSVDNQDLRLFVVPSKKGEEGGGMESSGDPRRKKVKTKDDETGQ